MLLLLLRLMYLLLLVESVVRAGWPAVSSPVVDRCCCWGRGLRKLEVVLACHHSSLRHILLLLNRLLLKGHDSSAFDLYIFVSFQYMLWHTYLPSTMWGVNERTSSSTDWSLKKMYPIPFDRSISVSKYTIRLIMALTTNWKMKRQFYGLISLGLWLIGKGAF